MPSERCNVVYQDSKGFIWIGTVSGFSKFDGLNFINFFPERNLKIHKFYEDEAGNVVAVGTYYHFKVLSDEKVMEFQPRKDYVFSNEYYSRALPKKLGVYEDKKGHKSIFRIQKDTLETVLETPILDKMAKDNGCFIYFDDVDSLWYIPTGNEGLFVVDNKGKIMERHNYFFESIIRFGNEIYAADYMSFEGGLYKKNKNGFQLIHKHFFAGNTQFLPVNDTVMLMKCSNFLYRYTTTSNNLEVLYSHAGYTFLLRNMLKDNEGNIWLATGSGLYNFFKLKIQHYQMNFNGNEKNIITGIAEIEKNNFYIGTMKADLIKIFSNGKIKEIKIPNPTWEDGWKCFFNTPVVSHKNIYAASCAALLNINNEKATFLTDWNFYIRSIFSYGNDTIGAISSYGVYLLDKFGNKLNYYSNKDLQQTERFSIKCGINYVKKNQKILAGEAGFSIIDHAGNIRLVSDTILLSTVGLAFDSEGLLWAIAENRLCTWNGNEAHLVYKFDDCLARSIKVIGKKYLLVATTKGFTLFDLKPSEQGKKIKTYYYDQNNGFMGIEPFYDGIFEDSSGYIWLMCQNGTFRFLPEQLINEQLSPRLYLNCFSSLNNINWGKIDNQSISAIPYKNNNFRFTFVGISYSATNHVRYYYRLIGFQNEWSEPTKNREITFNNLPPGNYVFEIYADAGTDDSRSEVQSFTFSIKPAFWQTAWFLFLCIISLLLSGAGTALYIQRRKNKILLEKLRTEKEINELRISTIRLKAIPHFNANILAAIEYYISNRTKEDTMRILEIYSDFTYKTLSEVDKAARPIEEELAYVKMYLELEKVRFIDKFDFNINVAEEVDKGVQLPNMILHTYCENAVKHGLMSLKSGGQLTIDVSQHERFVRVSVEDNGVGRTAAAQNKHVHSTKQGLSILNRQIEIYNRFNKEKINQWIDDLEMGTRFTVEVPVGYNFIN